jgi:hypothetical protein
MTGRRLRLVAGGILAIGLVSAMWIYLSAAAATGGAVEYDPDESKQYLRAMELYGGKANLLAAELRRWFDGLWHGRRLAYTVGCATLLLAGAFWLGAAASEVEEPR